MGLKLNCPSYQKHCSQEWVSLYVTEITPVEGLTLIPSTYSTGHAWHTGTAAELPETRAGISTLSDTALPPAPNPLELKQEVAKKPKDMSRVVIHHQRTHAKQEGLLRVQVLMLMPEQSQAKQDELADHPRQEGNQDTQAQSWHYPLSSHSPSQAVI